MSIGSINNYGGFSGISAKNTANAGLANSLFGSKNSLYTDYSLIKSGAYKKLLTAYYDQQKANDTTSTKKNPTHLNNFFSLFLSIWINLPSEVGVDEIRGVIAGAIRAEQENRKDRGQVDHPAEHQVLHRQPDSALSAAAGYTLYVLKKKRIA